MRKQQKRKPAPQAGGPPQPGERSAVDHAVRLIEVLRADPSRLKEAEQLDRLQASLERLERLEEVRDEVAALCDELAEEPLTGEPARTWLTLVGGFGVSDHSQRVAELADDTALPRPVRDHACRVLATLGGPYAARTLLDVLKSRTEPTLRATAAESLAQLGDRSVRPELERLLEEDLPRPVWTAVSAAVERLR